MELLVAIDIEFLPVRCGGREVVAVVDQIRAIAKERLLNFLCELSPDDLGLVEEAVREILELD
jgi:mRNA-degrading endonuclease toxin of MazEF toxin-antitoxin module